MPEPVDYERAGKELYRASVMYEQTFDLRAFAQRLKTEFQASASNADIDRLLVKLDQAERRQSELGVCELEQH